MYCAMPAIEAPAHARRSSGFATLTVLGLVAVAALLCAGALHDALFGEQLATSRMLHQRASALADHGVDDAVFRVAAQDAPRDLDYSIQPYPPSEDSVSVSVRHVGSTPLPRGFSAGRMEQHRLEIQSTAHTVRGIVVTQVQGATRVLPAAAPAAAAAP